MHATTQSPETHSIFTKNLFSLRFLNDIPVAIEMDHWVDYCFYAIKVLVMKENAMERRKMDRRNFVIQTVVGAGALSSVEESLALTTSTDTQSSVLSSTTPTAKPQFLTWDGGSGPNRDLWSKKLEIPWVHPGRGDWLDARQVPQGTTPFAAATVTGGWIKFDVTVLVNRWLSSGLNRGFYLSSQQAWPFNFAGRTYSTLALRPQLVLITSQGSSSAECICNATWSPSTYQGRDTRNAFSVAKDNQLAALQFDLSNVTGPVQSATLSLNCLSLTYPGTLAIFEVNPPTFRDGVGTATPLAGIADNYILDSGLNTHPSVLFSGDFSDMSKLRWQMGGVATGTTQVKDPVTQSTYLRGLIPQGQLLGSDLERVVVEGTKAGTPAKTENELYARYYVFLEDDWGSNVDANKMPGWDGRFGWWNTQGYWQGTTGNGGARPTGLKVKNVAANRWEYQGASMRGHGGTRINDGNPYDDLFWIGSYIYHLDQATAYGEGMSWPGVVMGKGRWYCVEHYIKMNSITGPFDTLGNGVAVKDGQYRVWVDGVQAYERTNFRWRRHPEMGVQGFWLNWYHGGTAPAPRTMHFRMDAVVIARAYIGPRRSK